MKKNNSTLTSRKVNTQSIVVAAVAVALAAFFSIVSPSFRMWPTIVTLFDSFYYFMFMAIGVTFCLISGGNDLSIGTGTVCYALIGGFFITKLGAPTWLGMLICIALGLAFGCLNGFLVAVMNLPAFIATLCTMLVTRGLGSVVAGGSITWPSRSVPAGWFRSIFKIFVKNAAGKKVPIPIGLILVAVAIIVMTIVLKKTLTGRYIIAIGSNKEAARLSGVNVVKYQAMAYVISGFFAGLAAIAYVSATSSSITPGAGGGLELDAFGGAIIGGTSMNGGTGSIFGTFLGVIILTLLKNGLPKIGLNAEWQSIITGLILIGAIWLDVIRSRKKV